MNRILKLWQPAMLAVFALAFNACTDEYEYTPQPDADYEGAYILADETDIILTADDVQELSFTVARHNDAEAGTYRLYSSNSGVQVPSEVTFNAGEKSKDFTVSFDVPVGTIDEEVVIGIEDEDTYMYGAHSQTFTISRLRKVEGAMWYEEGLFLTGGGWEANVYEQGITEAENGETVARFLVVEPYHNSDIENVLSLTANETTGYNVEIQLSSDGTATVSGALFYIPASMTGDPTVTGDAIPNGNGTYYSGTQSMPSSGNQLSNFILFPWNIRIGSTGLAFTNVSYEALVFPTGYEPMTQTQN